MLDGEERRQFDDDQLNECDLDRIGQTAARSPRRSRRRQSVAGV
jgi:hypothetical protein